MDFKAKRTIENNLEEVLCSTDLFLIRNYITTHKLMVGMSFREINDLYFLFTPLNSVFDFNALTKEYITLENKSFICMSCKKEFSNPFEISLNMECKGEPYHPKSFFGKNEKFDRLGCIHDACSKKNVYSKSNELPCCHKPRDSPGCMTNEGKHVIVFNE